MATYDVKNDTDAEQDALERLKRDYLPMWAELAYGSAVGRGAPGEVPYVNYMRPGVSMGDADEKPDPWVCNIVEASIDEITPKIPMARAALSVRYLNARGPSVYRSGRLYAYKSAEVEDLADAAELALVPVCKRRGLPL